LFSRRERLDGQPPRGRSHHNERIASVKMPQVHERSTIMKKPPAASLRKIGAAVIN
jgi:hypothetical protein